MMLQRLEEEGIKAYLQDEYTVTIDPILANAIGGIKLMIYKEQLERAIDLISSFEHAYKQAVVCPHCRSANIHYVTKPVNVSNWFAAMVIRLFGKDALSLKKIYQCSNCGFKSDFLPV